MKLSAQRRPPANLADYYLFDRLTEDLGDSVAIRYGQRQYSYAEIAERTTGLANFLGDCGVRPEERIYTVLPDTPPFAWSLFATFAMGAVAAMGNPHAPRSDLQYALAYSRAAVVITTPTVANDLADAFSAASHLRAILLVPETATGEDPEGPVSTEVLTALAGLDAVVCTLADALEQGRASGNSGPRVGQGDDPCMWLFTSGSTGRCKAAVHCHQDFIFNTEAYAKSTLGYCRADVSISVPRLFFGYATGTNLFFPFAVGATVGLFSERPDPASLSRAISMYRPTIVTNVPTMMSKLLDSAERPDMSSVRFQLSAGEALPPALYQRYIEQFGGAIYDGIGSAEMFHIYATNRPGDVKYGSLGRAVQGYELKILPQDADCPGGAALPPGEIGVLWVKGNSVALGYFGDRASSWHTFHGHWCRTGDLFQMDAQGYLYFAGRSDDLFKVSGVWVSPLEVETCLMNHRAVSLAAVIAVGHSGLLKPKAFVVLRPGVDSPKGDALKAQLQTHCKELLSKHKYPRSIEFLEELPRNDRGKVDKQRLATAGQHV